MLRNVVRTCTLGAAFALLVATHAIAETIDNDIVRLGVNASGSVNSQDEEGYFGVFHIPSASDGTRGGCPCEGWGAGAMSRSPVQGPTVFQGRANEAAGDEGIAPVSFESTPTSAVSVVDVLNGESPGLRVTHAYSPSPSTPNLFEIKITLENVRDGSLDSVRYERIMDWDIEPTETDEFVTINRGGKPPSSLLYSDDNGFSDNMPFTFADEGDGPNDETSANADYADKGPTDHGARFTFDFGSLAPGEKQEFFMYYGAAASEDEANAAVSAAALEMFSYGQPNVPDGDDPDELADGASQGKPATFIWGFRGVGGSAVIPPTLTLSPKTSTGDTGSQHAATGTLRDSAGRPVPGAKLVFEVGGANPNDGSSSTNADGQATHSWTGNSAGDDSIRVCLDANEDGACSSGEVSDTAQRSWAAPQPPPIFPPQPGPERRLGLTGPSTDLTGQLHSTTATVVSDGAALGGASLVWRVEGANPGSGTATTGGDGKTAIAWTGANPGRDTLTAFLDANGDSTRDQLEPEATHVVEWLAPPVVKKTANVEPVSGQVFVKLPPGANARRWKLGPAQANGFIPLSEARTVPIGSTMDTTKGRVDVRTAESISKPGQTQSGQFYDGVFQIKQVGGNTRPITEMVMNEAISCGKQSRRGKLQPAARRSRRLWGSGKGRFRTRGRHSSATVRGTVWLTKDTCTTTTTTVKSGVVVVRDFAKRKNVTVKKGKRYTARAKKRR